MNFKKLSDKTHGLHTDEKLADGENPFSTNKVTGHSLNYPIAATCSPTKVCIRECYFGSGPSTWTAALRKQWRLYHSTVADPSGTAARIAVWADRLKLTYVRWNGGGDLFPESVEAINRVAALRPRLPQWVVTRLPGLAADIKPAANVYVHCSIDRHSWGRAAPMLAYGGSWFWSYQCDAGEVPPADASPVNFYNHYKPGGHALTGDDCPLNTADDIAGVCSTCRRCFDGTAVRRAAELLPSLKSRLDSLIPGRNTAADCSGTPTE
jgi:hypothetical protein